MSVRIAAWSVLRSGATAPLRLVDGEADRRGLPPRDRALLRILVGTELRRRGTLRALVRDLAHRPPKPELSTHLHLGLVQLLFLDRVPDHAAVSETVDAVRYTLGGSKATIVNAILREAVRRREEGTSGDLRRDLPGRDLSWAVPVFRDPGDHPLLWIEDALSVPSALAKRWVKRHGEERAVRLARGFLEEPPLSVRVVVGERDAVEAELAEGGLRGRPGAHPAILVFPGELVGDVTESAAFAEGRITVQGATALRAAELAGAAPGEDALELCAAPGGKTAVLAGAGARVLAVDSSVRRLARLVGTTRRLGVADRVRPLAADGTAALAERDFDLALVDAPCSNTGILGARPAARWRFGPATLRELGRIQSRLLSEAAARVRPGGRLVWSTCSLEPEENEQLLRRFLAETPGWREEARVETLPDPDDGPTDGGFAARLRRD